MNYLQNIPKLTIQVESMKHSIVSMLDQKHDDMIACVMAGVDAAILEIPTTIMREAKEISLEAMRNSLSKALVEYWDHGQGRGMIDEAISKKFKTVKL